MCPCWLADSKRGNRCLARSSALLSFQPTATPGGQMDTCHVSHFCSDYWFPLDFVAELLEQHRWTRWLNKVAITFLNVYPLNVWISSHLLRWPRCETFKAAVINIRLVTADHMTMKVVYRKHSPYSAAFLLSVENYSLFSSLFSISVHSYGSRRILHLPQLCLVKKLWNREKAILSRLLVNTVKHLTAKGPMFP